jgi:hypothetical protein
MFRIQVVEQRRLTDRETDLCSHGRLSIAIGRVTVADGTEEFGISESTLRPSAHARLRPHVRIGGRSTHTHGCGAILMGCPIGIGWDVEHRAEGIHVSKVVLCDGTSHGERRLPIDLVGRHRILRRTDRSSPSGDLRGPNR